MTGGSGPDLPHWTDPPTGEVPRVLSDPGAEEDLAAWQALGSRGMRWRDGAEDWDEADELGDLAGEDTRLGTLDQSRTEHSDLYSFDDAFERLEEERSGGSAAVGTESFFADEPAPERISTSVRGSAGRSAPRRGGGRPVRTARTARRRPGVAIDGPNDGGRDVGTAAVVGAGLVVLLIIAYAIGSKALVVLSAAVIIACAVEAYGMLQRSGFRPATLLGLVATLGVVFGAYYRGIGALPLVTAVMLVATMLWYLLGIVEARPLANVAVTILTYLWVGVLGSFAAVMLRLPHGKGLLLGAVLTTVAADIVAYFAGSRIGTRPLAPDISPGKTIEGFAAGAAAALVVGAIIGHSVAPWGGVKHGLLLGLVVAVVAPVGDLFESMIKRDLSVKDSGTALPGHGGVLDRFDSMLLVLPAAFYLAYLFNVAA